MFGFEGMEVKRKRLTSSCCNPHLLCYTKFSGLVAQLVRAPPCHGGGRRFESDLGRSTAEAVGCYSGVLAQLGEHLPYKQRVIGSSPIGPIAEFNMMPMWLNWQSS